MKALVAVKRVIDPYVKVRVRADGSGVETAGVKMATNPFCENALEEALRWRDGGFLNEVIALSVGGDDSAETLRAALAVGADRAILVKVDAPAEPLAIAKIIKALALREEAKILLFGKQAIDGDYNQTAQMSAALLGWGQATFISKAAVEGEKIIAEREVDGGIEVLALKIPCVLSADLRLNEPRYATLPNIMKARKKPLETVAPADLEVDAAPRLQILHVGEPPARQAGVKVADAAELVDKLKNEAKVL